MVAHGPFVEVPVLAARARMTDDAEFRSDLHGMARMVSAGVWLNLTAAFALYAAGYAPRIHPWPILALGVAIQLNAWIAIVMAPTVRRPLVLYFVFHLLNAVCVTLMLWLGGGWFCPGAALFYALIVIDGGSGLSAHVLATLSAAAFAVMLALQRQAGGIDVPIEDQIAEVTMMLVGLNLVASYTGRLLALLQERRMALVSANDALERRVHERTRELEAQRRALEEQSERLRSVLYVVTHDLKNPLNAIHLSADLVLTRADGALDPPLRAALGRIAQQASGGEQKIARLMHLFRVTSTHEPEDDVPVRRIVDQAIELLQPMIGEKHIRVVIGDLPVVRGQSAKLGHIVTNLVGNAIKYVPAEQGVVTLRGGETTDGAWFEIADNGIGIGTEYHAGIFELFCRVPDAEQVVDGNVVPGTGVGLALVKQLTEQHGGRISVTSTPGTGSVFRVTLPCRAGAGRI